jgi:ABC-type glycerol-3-phosphate transport system substrate-binding protein
VTGGAARTIVASAMALLLAGCGARDEPDPSGITPSEAEALNDAAAMLDNESVTLNALDPPAEPAP